MHGPSPSSTTLIPQPDASREHWALYYASRGWPVLPLHSAEGHRCSCGEANCRSAGKHPRTQHGLKDASTDPEQIIRWWQKWPGTNVGIATGVASGILVFDVDPRNGGDASYEQLRNELPAAFAERLEVQTGSGGSHLYYECPSTTPSRANIRPGIDVKADGGYVVAPSSCHVSGSLYRFVSNSGLVPPPLPPALRDLILREAQAQVGGEESPKIVLDTLRVNDAIKNLIRDGKPKGQRSEAIFGAIRAMINAGHNDEQIIAVLVDPAHGLSEKPRENGEAWLIGEIKRAREKPDRDGSTEIPSNNHQGLVCRRASEIHPEPIRWLWPQRIALGKTSLIAGAPGLGKSQITTYLAAITSSGGTWPGGEKCEAGDVLFLSAEDDPADTIRPRLEARGADLDRVHIIEAVRDQQRERAFNLKHDLEALAAALAARPGAKLVVIDPISAYLGNIDSHKNAEVRGALAPLAKLAADHGVAIVCVTHLNKSPSADPLTRVIGSTAFGAAVRTAFLVARDKINPERRLFLPLKSNISRDCPGLAFRLESHVLPSGIETSRVAWESEPVTTTASEALSPSTPEEVDDARELVAASLRRFDSESFTELRASKLIELLREHEDLIINPKQLKKRLAGCGIRQRRRSDANYYLKADFVAASSSIPPGLHASTFQETGGSVASPETSTPPSLHAVSTFQDAPTVTCETVEGVENVEAVEAAGSSGGKE
jgi:Bifunctional DNA primase/polymerase, N-terminal/AAA domain